MWIVTPTNTGEYYQKFYESDENSFVCGSLHYVFNEPFEGYGKTWLAYKNKEQAEAKGEIVELRAPRIEPSNSPYGGYTIHWQKVVEDYGWCRDRAQAERRLAELKGEKHHEK